MLRKLGIITAFFSLTLLFACNSTANQNPNQVTNITQNPLIIMPTIISTMLVESNKPNAAIISNPVPLPTLTVMPTPINNPTPVPIPTSIMPTYTPSQNPTVVPTLTIVPTPINNPTPVPIPTSIMPTYTPSQFPTILPTLAISPTAVNIPTVIIPIPSQNPTVVPTLTIVPTPITNPTPVITPTAIASMTPSPTPSSTNITTSIPTANIPYIDMVTIPEGNFIMGADTSDPNATTAEKPQHTVYLDSYQIGKYEVTQAQYKIFIDDTGRAPPTGDWDPIIKANKPVTYVNWEDATAFCSWAGGRLPTEAEWEKASRGTDGRKYPWGNYAPSCNLLNFSNCVGTTTVVGSYPNGASPYGVMDMAGNVQEWCSDWWSDTYYSSSPSSNPTGPASPGGGYNRVTRSSYFDWGAVSVTCSSRGGLNLGVRHKNFGFRIAK